MAGGRGRGEQVLVREGIHPTARRYLYIHILYRRLYSVRPVNPVSASQCESPCIIVTANTALAGGPRLGTANASQAVVFFLFGLNVIYALYIRALTTEQPGFQQTKIAYYCCYS